MEGRRLKVWMGHADEDAPVAKPTPGEVLYAHPNPDRTRKMCRNCVLWMPAMQQCFIHDSDVSIGPDQVCGYHVFGTPSTQALSRENLDPVEPALSGLVKVEGGTSCDTCTHYSPRGAQQGSCAAVKGFREDQRHAEVAALGCCTRWAEKHG